MINEDKINSKTYILNNNPFSVAIDPTNLASLYSSHYLLISEFQTPGLYQCVTVIMTLVFHFRPPTKFQFQRLVCLLLFLILNSSLRF